MADFERKKYESDRGNVFYCRMDNYSAVQTVAGSEPEGEVTEELTILVSKTDGEFGIRPRLAIYKRPLGEANTDGDRYVKQGAAYKRVAILTPARYVELDADTAPDIVIGGITFKYNGKLQEQVR